MGPIIVFKLIRSRLHVLLYIQLTISFLIGRKRTVNFRNQRLGRHLAADYTIIIPRTLKVTGNHVMYDRGAWFLRVIMSSSRALCCLPSVKKQKHDFQVFFVDLARHRKSSWRQGLTNTKRSTKVAKELFADYVKEKKLREPEEKKELAQTLKTFLMCRNEKERIRSMYKTNIRFGFCDIQNNQGLGKSHQPQPSAITTTSTLIIVDITKTSPWLIIVC